MSLVQWKHCTFRLTMRNPFTYLRELNKKVQETQQRIVQETLRANKAESELAKAKVAIQELQLEVRSAKTYIEVLECSFKANKHKDNKNQYDELDIPKK